MEYITYCKGNYKYLLQLDAENANVVENNGKLWYRHKLGFDLGSDVDCGKSLNFLYLRVEESGSYLYIRNFYAWDGASGPTIDTKNSQRGSLVHDSLWQMVNEGSLPEKYRLNSDEELHRLLVEDGMSRLRARAWKFSVSNFGAKWVKFFGTKRRVVRAPKK